MNVGVQVLVWTCVFISSQGEGGLGHVAGAYSVLETAGGMLSRLPPFTFPQVREGSGSSSPSILGDTCSCHLRDPPVLQGGSRRCTVLEGLKRRGVTTVQGCASQAVVLQLEPSSASRRRWLCPPLSDSAALGQLGVASLRSSRAPAAPAQRPDLEKHFAKVLGPWVITGQSVSPPSSVMVLVV